MPGSPGDYEVLMGAGIGIGAARVPSQMGKAVGNHPPPGSGLKGQGVEVRDAGMPQGAGMGPVDWECHPVRGAFVMEVEGEKGRE